jgi:hypothetical protein
MHVPKNYGIRKIPQCGEAGEAAPGCRQQAACCRPQATGDKLKAKGKRQTTGIFIEYSDYLSNRIVAGLCR